MPGSSPGQDDGTLSFRGDAQASNLRCAIAHWGISRFSGAQLRTVVRVLTDRPGMTTYYTLSCNAAPISSSTFGSSMVAGMVQGSPSAIFLMVPRRILRGRVLGNGRTGAGGCIP